MAIKPYRQGELDGFCGLYAIVNAVGWLKDSRRLDEAEGFRLMKALAESIADRFPRAIWDGTKVPQMRKMLAAADLFAQRRLRFAIDWSQPFAKRAPTTPRAFHKALSAHLARDRVAIVGLAPPWDHWTLARATTADGYHILDSIEIKRIEIGRTAVRAHVRDKPNPKADYEFDARQTFVLARAEIE